MSPRQRWSMRSAVPVACDLQSPPVKAIWRNPPDALCRIPSAQVAQMHPANPIWGSSPDAQPNGSPPTTLKNGSSLREKNRDGREGGQGRRHTFFQTRRFLRKTAKLAVLSGFTHREFSVWADGKHRKSSVRFGQTSDTLHTCRKAA